MSCSVEACAMEYWSYVSSIVASFAVVVVSLSGIYAGICESRKWLNERHIDRSKKHQERKVKLSIRILSFLYRIQSEMVKVRWPYKLASTLEVENAKSNLKLFELSDLQIKNQEDKLKAQVFINRFNSVEKIRQKINKHLPKIQIVLGDNARKEIDEFYSFLSSLRMDAMGVIFEHPDAKSVDSLFYDFEKEKISDDIGEEIYNRIKKIEKVLKLN